MIIFDLDGTIANCEHRRHFVDPTKIINSEYGNSDWVKSYSPEGDFLGYVNVRNPIKFKPDWKAFYESCDKDTVNNPVAEVIRCMLGYDYYDNQADIHIWSARCESVRLKTQKWLDDNRIVYQSLKMRPIGDYTPDDELKEKWLDELLIGRPLGWGYMKHPVKMVFDDRKKVIQMWQRRGVFVFDVSQGKGDF